MNTCPHGDIEMCQVCFKKKICPVCKKEKQPREFYRRRGGQLSSNCKPCTLKYGTDWRAKLKEQESKFPKEKRVQSIYEIFSKMERTT